MYFWDEPLLCSALAQQGFIFAPFINSINLNIMFFGILVAIGTCIDIFLYLFCGKKEL